MISTALPDSCGLLQSMLNADPGVLLQGTTGHKLCRVPRAYLLKRQ